MTELEKAAQAALKLIQDNDHIGVDVSRQIRVVLRLAKALRVDLKCQECGCTQSKACPGGCSWVSAAHCSSCSPLNT